MPSPTRERLLQAAVELFSSQGVQETTTRQIAERAAVNEVTLFRQFGNKQGLLLAVIEASQVFLDLKESVLPASTQTLQARIKHYAGSRLQTFSQLPEFMLSVVTGVRRHSLEEKVLTRSLAEADQALVAQLGETADARPRLPPLQIAALLNTLLIGWAVSHTHSEEAPWRDREHFLEDVVELFMHGAFAEVPPARAADLDAPLVHAILERARKSGAQDYALLYVLFAAGLSAEEVATLKRQEQICTKDRHLLRVRGREVPLNRHILGRTYGSYTNNPLTRYLKTRRSGDALFISEAGGPITPEEVQFRWAVCTHDLPEAGGEPPGIEQARDTWCVEMFIRGMEPETLALLSGRPREQLQPYLERARAKTALDRALEFDRP